MLYCVIFNTVELILIYDNANYKGDENLLKDKFR